MNKHKFVIVLSMLTVLVVYSPNIQEDVIIGSDWPFHLARIETLAEEIGRGIFPVKFHSDLCYGFGYGVGFFYPNFFLYIPAVLINLGLSLEVAYKVFAGMLQVGIFAGMYYAAFRLTRNKYSALAAAMLYQFSLLCVESFYTHFTLGRSEAMVFLPLAIVGMYLLLTEGQPKGGGRNGCLAWGLPDWSIPMC